MTEKIPEEKQYQYLLEQLAGNEAFNLLRNLRRDKKSSDFMQVADWTDSPSDFCSQWDKISPAKRIMGNFLAKLKRDGYDKAYEVLRMVMIQGKDLPGEVIPLDEKVAISFIMPQPEKTLLLFRFAQWHHWKNWIPQSAKEVFDNFLELHYFWNQHAKVDGKYKFNRGFDIYDGGAGNAIRKALGNLHGTFELDEKDCHETFLQRKYYNDHVELAPGFGGASFIHYKVEARKELIKLFSRDQQQDMTIWQVNLPAYHFINNFRNKCPDSILLIPEDLASEYWNGIGYLSDKPYHGYSLWIGHDYSWKAGIQKGNLNHEDFPDSCGKAYQDSKILVLTTDK